MFDGYASSGLQTATAATAVAVQTGVSVSVSPDAANAASSTSAPSGLPASGYFVQHAVFKVGQFSSVGPVGNFSLFGGRVLFRRFGKTRDRFCMHVAGTGCICSATAVLC